MAFKKSIIPSKRFVIASTLGCVAISFPLFLVACSNASSSSADETNETAELANPGSTSMALCHPLHKEVVSV